MPGRLLLQVMEMRANELRARSSQLEAAQVKGGHLEENLRLQRKKTEKMAMELEASKERLSKAEQGLKESLATNQAKAIENNEMSVELRKIDAEVAQLYQEQLRQTKAKDGLLKKLKTVEVERIAVQRESETIRSQAASLNREIDIEVKETLSAKTQAAEVRAELEELNEALDKAADSTQRQVAIAKLNQKMIKDLEAEISAFKR